MSHGLIGASTTSSSSYWATKGKCYHESEYSNFCLLLFASSREVPKTQRQLTPAQQLLIAPLTFISFLVSLALIDARNLNWRRTAHQPNPLPGKSKQKTRRWLGREAREESPYAYVRSPAPEKAGKGDAKMSMGKQESWYLHSKQREVMRMEFSDALALKRKVSVVLVTLLCAATAALAWILYVWRRT